ncbi:unnamed protein product [Heterobilharzia americana]|nr:unnamed protein product [Heterobilharzia americana]
MFLSFFVGLPPSRRGDLEILFFNLIHWLARSHPNSSQSHFTGLPWGHLISDPKLRANVPDRVKMAVADEKEKTMKSPGEFVLQAGYGPNADLLSFIQCILQLGYADTPDYGYLRKCLYSAKCSIGKQMVSSCKSTLSSDQTSTSSPSRRKYNAKNTSKISDSCALNSVENLDCMNSISKTPDSLPAKRSRGRPPGRCKQVENISPVVSDRRRSGWCQTSPELLAVAKAEALGRRALKLAEMKLS